MLLETNIKLLLINLHPNEEENYIFDEFGARYSTADTLFFSKAIPFPLEIDINNFSFYNELNKVPGIKSFIHAGNVVTGVQKTLIITTSQKTSASGALGIGAINPLLDDNATANNSSLTQEQTGSQLQLEITFEPKSKLPLILDGYLTVASSKVKDYMFSYISNELVVFNLVLGSFATNATEENIVTSINFIEKPSNKAKNVKTVQVKNPNKIIL